MSRHTKLGTLALATIVASIVHAQDEPPPGVDAPAAAAMPETEIVVRGRSRAFLRLQIQQAEEAVYDRFNAINSDDDFDIHCRREVFIGSRIPRRVCEPVLWRKAMQSIGEETVRALQGGPSMNIAMFQGEALYKGQQLEAEFRRLALEDTQLQDAVVHLGRLKTTAANKDTPRMVSPVPIIEIKAADVEPLDYGAALTANVWIRRDPLRHALTHPIFTVANVFGEIRSVDLECGGSTSTIEYEEGIEWRVPADADSCIVTVSAEPDTTFVLYEFEQ